MNRAALEKALRRLKDIIVSELSLVDRPANQTPFLITKRSESVGDEIAATTESIETDATSAGGRATDGAETEATEPENATLSVAVQALESLTQAVESLDSDEGLGEMEGELRDALRALMAHLGMGESPPAESPESTPEPEQEGARTKFLEELRGAIGELRDLAEKLAPRTQASSSGDAASDRIEQVRDALATLESTVRSFGETVNKQEARLARVEKQFGLPQSRAVGGAPKPEPSAA